VSADAPIGAKERDYWWTVLAVDPLAIPVTRVIARREAVTPDRITVLSLVLGLGVGPLFAVGARWALICGGVLFYISFMFDCVDGKLARIRGASAPRGKALDRLADGARRASSVLGLAVYLWNEGETRSEVWWAVVFGVMAFYFMEISGLEKRQTGGASRRKWRAALERRRLLPTPGMPDASAIVFVIGPIAGVVVPALVVGIAMMAVAILMGVVRAFRQ
jgi:phosphatidylglycerophosphate synthase